VLIIAAHSLEMNLECTVEPILEYVRYRKGPEAPCMAIDRFIETGSFDRPEVARLQEAYEITLKALCLVDRNDPLTEIVARKIIQIGEIGIDDPARLSARAIRELGLPDRA
jgi:hypothetical protein